MSNGSKEIIKRILLGLDTIKDSGIDQIPVKRFLKDGTEVLGLPSRYIMNLSIKLSIFPAEYKFAQLKPIFKRGVRIDPQNYRYISILPQVSKIIEKSIHLKTTLIRKN